MFCLNYLIITKYVQIYIAYDFKFLPFKLRGILQFYAESHIAICQHHSHISTYVVFSYDFYLYFDLIL